MLRPPQIATLFPYTTLFRSSRRLEATIRKQGAHQRTSERQLFHAVTPGSFLPHPLPRRQASARKSPDHFEAEDRWLPVHAAFARSSARERESRANGAETLQRAAAAFAQEAARTGHRPGTHGRPCAWMLLPGAERVKLSRWA